MHPLEPRAVDMEFLPAAADAWQFAIDPDTLAFTNTPPMSGVLPSPIYDAGLPPFTLSVSACPIDWPVAGDMFAAPPPENPTCLGAFQNITLWPFGVRCPLVNFRRRLIVVLFRLRNCALASSLLLRFGRRFSRSRILTRCRFKFEVRTSENGNCIRSHFFFLLVSDFFFALVWSSL